MAVEYKDYYKLLGVSKTATKDEIAKAFKKLARKYHPDLNQGDKKAESKFKDINEAYEVLKDDEKRRLYDTLGPDWQNAQHQQGAGGAYGGNPFGGGGFGGFSPGGQSFNASGFSDFFESLFGSGRGGGGASFGGDPFAGFTQRSRRGQDVDATIQLSLEDAYRGGKKTISLQTSDGKTRSLEVNIPAGVKNGARIRLSKQGDPGAGKDAAPGDLYLHVSLLPHPKFGLDDNDLVYTLPITPWEAVLGAKVRVPTLDGEIELTVPPGSGSQKKFRLRGKGLGAGTAKGDQFVRLAIEVPSALSDEEKTLWEKLRDLSSFNPR